MEALLLSIAIGQYARSHASETDLTTQCLWWKEGSQIVYRSNVLGNGDETPGDTEFDAIRAAFNSWQVELEKCASLTLVEGPRTNNRKAEYLEARGAVNENVVVFRQRACQLAAPPRDPCFVDGSCGNLYDCWQYGEGAIAITTTSYSPSSTQVLDSDVELNPTYFFTTVEGRPCATTMQNASCVATDVQNTMTHEAGHLLGLAHYTEDPLSTMAKTASIGELTKRVIDPGSKRFLCDVYPKGGYSKLCFVPRLKTESGKAAEPGCGCSSLGEGAFGVLALFVLRRKKR